MIPGETIRTGAAEACPDCNVMLVEAVHMSAAGHYIGTWCDCGPYSRESDYYRSREEAQTALDAWAVDYRDRDEDE